MKWTKLKDKRPEQGQKVLVYFNELHHEIMIYQGSTGSEPEWGEEWWTPITSPPEH